MDFKILLVITIYFEFRICDILLYYKQSNTFTSKVYTIYIYTVKSTLEVIKGDISP